MLKGAHTRRLSEWTLRKRSALCVRREEETTIRREAPCSSQSAPPFPSTPTKLATRPCRPPLLLLRQALEAPRPISSLEYSAAGFVYHRLTATHPHLISVQLRFAFAGSIDRRRVPSSRCRRSGLCEVGSSARWGNGFRVALNLDDAGEVAGHWLLNSWGELNAVMGS